MAIYQISKIQVRRGKRDQLPQLASGEMAWAVDTQELFIGNGSIGEGAPTVGNTKILTGASLSFEDIIYTYKTIGIPRTGQDRLEDRVSSRDVGLVPEGVTDFNPIGTPDNNRQQLQTFIDTYFNQADIDNDFHAPLEIEVFPGTYYFSDKIILSKNVKIVGSGINRTIFIFDAAGSTTEAGILLDTRIFDSYYDDFISPEPTEVDNPSYIMFKDMTIVFRNNYETGVLLRSAQHCKFENVLIDGEFTSVKAVRTESRNEYVNCINNEFKNVTIQHCDTGIELGGTTSNNTIDGCTFENNTIHATFKNVPSNNIIENCTFYNKLDIESSGIQLLVGHSNTSSSNSFINVKYPLQISDKNISLNDIFLDKTGVDVDGITGSSVNFANNKTYKITLNSASNATAYTIPIAQTQSFAVKYITVINNEVKRTGTLFISATTTKLISFSDEFDSSEINDPLVFTASVADSKITIKYSTDAQIVLKYTYSLLK